ncbi:MAG: VOC family protein [Burkholderiales bacterium]|nr:VOC family protein [Burkholderiales bacterium]
MTSSSLTQGIDHVGLTVRDLNRTRDFFISCLGWKQVGERPAYPAAFVSDGHITLTLWEVKDHGNAVGFDRRANIGLHHLALRVADEQSLVDIVERIAAWPDTTIEFTPELLGQGPKKHAMVYEPSGIRLEFTCDPTAHSGANGAG